MFAVRLRYDGPTFGVRLWFNMCTFIIPFLTHPFGLWLLNEQAPSCYEFGLEKSSNGKTRVILYPMKAIEKVTLRWKKPTRNCICTLINSGNQSLDFFFVCTIKETRACEGTNKFESKLHIFIPVQRKRLKNFPWGVTRLISSSRVDDSAWSKMIL